MDYHIELRQKNTIAVGDTIERDGKLVTVCRTDITTGFMGVCLFGDSYRLGTLPVRLAVIKKPAIAFRQVAA